VCQTSNATGRRTTPFPVLTTVTPTRSGLLAFMNGNRLPLWIAVIVLTSGDALLSDPLHLVLLLGLKRFPLSVVTAVHSGSLGRSAEPWSRTVPTEVCP